MTESELSKKGREIRRELIGDTLVDKMASSVYDDPIMEKFGE